MIFNLGHIAFIHRKSLRAEEDTMKKFLMREDNKKAITNGFLE